MLKNIIYLGKMNKKGEHGEVITFVSFFRLSISYVIDVGSQEYIDLL